MNKYVNVKSDCRWSSVRVDGIEFTKIHATRLSPAQLTPAIEKSPDLEISDTPPDGLQVVSISGLPIQ